MKEEKKLLLARIRWLSRLLDAQFKFGPWRVGWDAIIGLLPGIGDTVGLVLSIYIWLVGFQLGVSGVSLGKIALLIIGDYLLGLIPLLGDMGDIFLRVNQRAVRIIERDLGQG